jgi:uncharacterized protein YutE (UPF0331/DUF86 family)
MTSAHEYEKIDLKIVDRVWQKNSKDLDSFYRAVVKKFKL